MPAIASTRASRATSRISSILIATAALLGAHPAIAATLIVRYAFDETSGPTINDSAGTNTAATETGVGVHLYNQAPIPAGDYGLLTIGDGQLGATGRQLSGADPWVTAANNELGALTNDFTVMAWVQTSGGGTRRIIGRRLNGTNGWSFGLSDNNSLILTRFGVADFFSPISATSYLQWTHVAVAKSSRTGITFFVNGVPFSNLPAETGPWAASSDPWNLSALDVGNQELDEPVDDIRVYDGALDAEGIRQALETSGTLIANYTFGESFGPNRYDSVGTATDASESGFASGVVYGAASIPPGAYGSLNIAGSTFGLNGGQSIADGEWLTQGNNALGALTNDFTVMAWVKPDPFFLRQRIIGRADSGNGGWGFGIEQGGPGGAAFIFTGYGVIDAVSTGTPIQPNTWQHVAATKSSLAGVSFYLNGNLVQRLGGFTDAWLPSTDAWSLMGSTEPLAGMVDEVRVYQGVLDTQSIRDAASGLICSAPNLILPASGTVSDDMVVEDIDSIADLNVKLDVSHTRVGDLTVQVVNLDTATVATLVFEPQSGDCEGRDIVATFDDSAAASANDVCDDEAPSISGAYKPSFPLSAFIDEPLGGTWRLTVQDNTAQNGGTLNRWCLQVQKATGTNLVFGNGFE